MKVLKAVLLMGLMLAPGVSWGQFISHGEQPNVIIFDDFKSQSTETNGALWVGGDMTVSSYSVGQSLSGVLSDHASLVVQGNLNYNNGQVFHGSAYVGGTVSSSGFNIPNGSLQQSVPVDFGQVYSSATNKAQQLSQMADAYTSLSIDYGSVMNLTLKSGVNVVNIAGSQLKNVNTFNISGNSDSVVIFNVSDTQYLHEAWAGMNENQLVGVTSNQILFNFYNAEEVKLDRLTGILGSVLAPHANVIGGWGSMRGQLIAESYQGNIEFYNQFFNWPQPIPEPATVAIMGVLGLGVVVVVRQRWRRSPTNPKP